MPSTDDASDHEASEAHGPHLSTSTPRRGLRVFRGEQAPPIQDTTMVPTPAFEPEAAAQVHEWMRGGGQSTRVLFGDPEGGGMSLLWVCFGPDFILPRHNHGADCLYFVRRGEVRMGNTVVREGDGFFVPAGAPYAYTAGPEGVEVLEFRNVCTVDLNITESLPRWEQILGGVRANRERWATEDAAST